MITKNYDRPQSLSKKNIRVTDILVKSREKINHKSIKKQKHDSIDYGTDSKKKSNSQSYLGDVEDMRAVIQSCQSCLEKISQFTTKKPKPPQNKHEDKSTQTVQKPFLVDLIQERVNQVCRKNRKLSKLLLEKQSELVERQSQIAEIQQKFTNILYSLGQQLSYLKTVRLDADQMRVGMPTSTDTPAYLKALMMDTNR